MIKVNLSKKPYNLNEEQIAWVEDLLNSLSVEEKIKQLFWILTASKDEGYLKSVTSTMEFGGARYNPMSAKDVFNQNKILQENSRIPLLIAANTEQGGNGACREGTCVGSETKVASTRDLKLAYELGKISALEAKAVGVNVLFSPIVDIHNNFHNPIISNKTFGNDPELVKNMANEYLRAAKEVGVLACAKHFPGDGYDERDQHLANSINPLSTSDWDNSFGKVYQSLIDNGLPMVMIGHIKLPSYQKHFDSKATDADIKPATICKELVTDLLKDKLRFNGLVTTDATHMVGLTSSMKRSEFLPLIIESGCDMILFYNDFEEDFKYMMDAYNDGRLTLERVNDAVRRILGMKAKLFMVSDIRDNIPTEEGLSIIGNPRHKEVSNEVCKKGITLVKNLDNIFPLDKSKIKRVLIVPQEDANPFEMFMPKGMPTIYDYIKAKLEAEGFEVTIFVSLMDKIKTMSPQEAMPLVANVYNNKTPVTNLTDNYDLVIQFANFMSNNTVQRISWKLSKGTADVPWYVHELPTIFVSLNSPFHLFDVPQVRTYINCYDKNKNTIDSLVNKFVGKEEFLGVSPVDAFCGDISCKY